MHRLKQVSIEKLVVWLEKSVNLSIIWIGGKVIIHYISICTLICAVNLSTMHVTHMYFLTSELG